MKNKNPFGEIRNAFEYAMKNGIDPKRPETWDEKYKKRMQKLAGIIPSIEKELNEIKKLF
ncbi:MAG TPA: hypothetical protein PLY69_10255 [Bacteroidales bacterium]|nr:hypothetical protein [Bacteroidales bacterium]